MYVPQTPNLKIEVRPYANRFEIQDSPGLGDRSQSGLIGSVIIDAALMDKVDLWEYEKVLICNVTNGQRWETYTLPGEWGSGEVSVQGAGDLLCNEGDCLIILSFEASEEPIKPQMILGGVVKSAVIPARVGIRINLGPNTTLLVRILDSRLRGNDGNMQLTTLPSRPG